MRSFLLTVILTGFLYNLVLGQIRISDNNSAWELKQFQEAMRFQGNKEYDKAVPLFEIISQILLAENKIEDAVEVQFQHAKALMHQWKTEEALEVHLKSLELSRNNNLTLHLADALMACASIYVFMEQDSLARECVGEGIKLEGLTSKDYSDLYLAYGGHMRNENKPDSAIIWGEKALQIDLQSNDTTSLIFCYLDNATFYQANKNYEKAIEYALKSQSYVARPRDQFKLVTIYNITASLLLELNSLKRAKYYADASVSLAKELNLKSGLAKSLLMQAQIYAAIGDCAKASEISEESNQINSKVGNKQTRLSNDVSIIRCKLKNEIPIDEKEISDIIGQRDHFENYISRSLIDLLELQYKVAFGKANNFDEEYGALKLKAQETSDLVLIRDLEKAKYDWYKSKGQLAEAMSSLESFNLVATELDQKEETFNALEMEILHEQEKRAQEVQRLTFENENNQARISRQRVLSILGLLTALIFALLSIWVFRLYRRVNRQKEKVSSALSEKEFLLKEIHHRVKNNLQVISSILSIQSRQIDDPEIRRAVNESKNRVRSMALIHQNLYQNEDLNSVSVQSYLNDLIAELYSTYKVDRNKVLLEKKIDDLKLDVDTMVPLGLIINELVSNCFKHAFPEGKDGEIKIRLSEKEDALVFSVKDNGIGVDLETINNSKSFGNRLINSLSRKIKAEVEIVNQNGTEVILTAHNYKKVV